MHKIKAGNKNNNNTKAQIDISFGMIFSLILIAVFIAVAIFAIKAFLEQKKSISEGIIVRDLQTEVDRIWRSSQGETNYKFERRISDKITHVCFYDREKQISGGFQDMGKELKRTGSSEANLYFYPVRESSLESAKIDNINMVLSMNPYCIPTEGGFIEITLSKDIGESLVRVV
ncbi:hypothetical protein COX97_03745 [Candidatus Pacearchaeota archaeon CG_4_10_14_0_2_um_filter_05_32_18]|nr:MAG: hypothetical protein COX97_03745 [Candidatus Pacearchaeota archaeon CG_4_10_14_0_2_um_filter_05_32_18]